MKKIEKPRAFVFDENDYELLGLDRKKVAVWEDGTRTDGRKGTFEWWYFDVSFANGNTLVIIFYTKNIIAIQKGLQPLITVNMTDPQGKELFSKVILGDPKDSSFSSQTCDVRIGKNRVAGDLREYRIHLDTADIRADLTLRNSVEAYRPGTGHAFFEKRNQHRFFAWLPAVPQGRVSGSLNLGGIDHSVDGSGYHDHNWGNALMPQLLHHWYWGRAEVGPYTLITSHMVAAPRFGSTHQDIFILFHEGKLVAENPWTATCSFNHVYMDERTNKPVANRLTFRHEDGKTRYQITFERSRDISRNQFIDLLRGPKKWLARLIGFDGAYLRFSGTVSVEGFHGDECTDRISAVSAVWELMYFGHSAEEVNS